MTTVTEPASSGKDFASLRIAGKDALSLALIDTRNRTLRWVAALEPHAASLAEGVDPLPWTLGHVAWFQERWIARHVQRARGEQADAAAPRLPSLRADADECFDPSLAAPARRRGLCEQAAFDGDAARGYAFETLEATLELLDGTPVHARDDGGDDGLYFFRLALFQEAMQEERLAEAAQAGGIDTGLVAAPTPLPPRPELVFPATRWLLGASSGGFAFDNQKPAHVVDIPEFAIDSQPVSWAQYAEFVEDGGYDDDAHWSTAGRAWLAQEGRRSPRYIEQIRHSVLQRRFGKSMRVPLSSAAVHVSAHEADAWCRWAGRRLPGEVEWEAAAHQGTMRGFRWGQVREWTATTLRPWPGFVAGPWRELSVPAFGRARTLRGASIATPPSLAGLRIRGWAAPERDEGFVGFRSCAA